MRRQDRTAAADALGGEEAGARLSPRMAHMPQERRTCAKNGLGAEKCAERGAGEDKDAGKIAAATRRQRMPSERARRGMRPATAAQNGT